MSALFVSSTGCDVINPAGFVQQNYIHRTHHCLRFLNLTLYCRSWPECILWIRSVLGQQSGDTLFKGVRSPGQKGINPIHQALDTKLINHSALFYHRRETTPETNGLRLIQLFTFPRWSRKKKLIKLSFKQLEQRAHKCLFNQRSTSGSVYREDASCVVSLYMNCFRRYYIFHLYVSSGTKAHVSSEGAEEENESRNPKSIKEPRAETSGVRIMKQQRRVFLLYLWRTRPGCESFRVTLSSRNETPRLHVTHFLLKLEETKLMRAQRGGERERRLILETRGVEESDDL